MTVPRPAMLRALAMGQLTMVVPAMGEDYAGKSAASIALLLLMLAEDQDRADAAFPALKAETLALAADSPCPLPEGLDSAPQDDAEQRLLGLLGAIRQWAEDADPAIAARAMGILARWTAARAIAIPVLPGG